MTARKRNAGITAEAIAASPKLSMMYLDLLKQASQIVWKTEKETTQQLLQVLRLHDDLIECGGVVID